MSQWRALCECPNDDNAGAAEVSHEHSVVGCMRGRRRNIRGHALNPPLSSQPNKPSIPIPNLQPPAKVRGP